MTASNDCGSASGKSAPPLEKNEVDEVASSHNYLLELPSQLRIEIYKVALCQPEGAHVNLKTGCVDRKWIALTMTNKQIRKECGNLYFAVNTFVFRFTYRGDTDADPTYDWFDEQATFNYFV